MRETLAAAKSEVAWTQDNEETWESIRSNSSPAHQAVVVQMNAKMNMIAELENGLSCFDDTMRSVLAPAPPLDIDVPITTIATQGHHISNYEKCAALRHVLSHYVRLVDDRPVATYQTFRFGAYTILGTQLTALWHAVHGLEYVRAAEGHNEDYALDFEEVGAIADLIPIRRPRDAMSTLVNAITSVCIELNKRVNPRSTYYAKNELSQVRLRLGDGASAEDISVVDRNVVRFVELGSDRRGLQRVYGFVCDDAMSICMSYPALNMASILQIRGDVHGINVTSEFVTSDCSRHVLAYFRDLAGTVGLRHPYGVLMERLGRDDSVLLSTYRDTIDAICVSHGVLMDPFDVRRLHRVILARIFQIPGFDLNVGEPGERGFSRATGRLSPGISRRRRAVSPVEPARLSSAEHAALAAALVDPSVMAAKNDGVTRILQGAHELPEVVDGEVEIDLNVVSLPTIRHLWEYVLGSGAEPEYDSSSDGSI